MKALFIVTGRGLGGDAMVALNTMRALEKRGVTCEIALDASAHGTLFENNGYVWHKISVPHAGGHSATKLSAAKGGAKLLAATFKARNLIKKLKVDFVVGVLGGGAIVASLGGKFARKPTFSLISTPLDSKFCPKFNQCYILPELDMFRWDNLPANMEKAFYPIFKGTIDAINLTLDEYGDKYNLVLVGLPLHDEYYDLIDEEKVIYVGYINWINDLFRYADLSVLTDDGVSLEEALVAKTPIIALTKVKWGRYQNMAGVFKGAIIESEVSDVCKSIEEAFENMDSLKENAVKYGKLCSDAADDLADRILKKVE